MTSVRTVFASLVLSVFLLSGCGLILDGVSDEPPPAEDAGADADAADVSDDGPLPTDGGDDGEPIDASEDSGEGSEDGSPPDAIDDGDTPPCPVGEERCGDRCVDLTRDTLNCGVCGRECELGCQGGSCLAESCSDRIDCAEGELCCGVDCVDQEVDPFHCGGCGIACPSGICLGADCVPPMECSLDSECPPGWGCCDGGECLPLDTVVNCGGCGDACPPPIGGDAVCIAAACGIRCSAGQQDCDGRCVAADRPCEE